MWDFVRAAASASAGLGIGAGKPLVRLVPKKSATLRQAGILEEKQIEMYPNLKLQLWRTGMRQNRLAQLVGMDETLLSKIVNGFREPNPQLRVKIAAALQSEETWLFERVDGHPPSEDGLSVAMKKFPAS